MRRDGATREDRSAAGRASTGGEVTAAMAGVTAGVVRREHRREDRSGAGPAQDPRAEPSLRTRPARSRLALPAVALSTTFAGYRLT